MNFIELYCASSSFNDDQSLKSPLSDAVKLATNADI